VLVGRDRVGSSHGLWARMNPAASDSLVILSCQTPWIQDFAPDQGMEA
jgi:hypothetical protein